MLPNTLTALFQAALAFASRGLSAILFACVFVLSDSAAARDLTEKEKAELSEVIDSFIEATLARNYPGILATMPPRALEYLANQSGVDLPTIKREMVKVFEKALNSEGLEFVAFTMDVSSMEQRELADGTPYALVPTEVVLGTPQGKFRSSTQTLALLDGGEWYLARVADFRQLVLLKAAYPEFANVEFEGATMEATD